MSAAAEVVALGLTKVGFNYSTGPTRDTGVDGYYDCSGFVTFLDREKGSGAFPYFFGSHDQALYCRDHGLLVPGQPGSQAQIDATPIGGLLFKGPAHSYVGGTGIPGHVVVKIGPNATVEAMGKAWGVCIGRIAGRGWSNAGLLPGVDYSSGTTVLDHPDPVEGPQFGDDMAAVIPAHGRYVNGVKPFASLDLQEGRVICFNGMQIKWRMAKETVAVPFDKALVYDVPINGPFLDMSEGEVVRVMPDGEHIVQKDGTLLVLAGDGGIATADIILP